MELSKVMSDLGERLSGEEVRLLIKLNCQNNLSFTEMHPIIKLKPKKYLD